jgi:hypothetical protein
VTTRRHPERPDRPRSRRRALCGTDLRRLPTLCAGPGGRSCAPRWQPRPPGLAGAPAVLALAQRRGGRGAAGLAWVRDLWWWMRRHRWGQVAPGGRVRRDRGLAGAGVPSGDPLGVGRTLRDLLGRVTGPAVVFTVTSCSSATRAALAGERGSSGPGVFGRLSRCSPSRRAWQPWRSGGCWIICSPFGPARARRRWGSPQGNRARAS